MCENDGFKPQRSSSGPIFYGPNANKRVARCTGCGRIVATPCVACQVERRKDFVRENRSSAVELTRWARDRMPFHAAEFDRPYWGVCDDREFWFGTKYSAIVARAIAWALNELGRHPLAKDDQ